MEVTYVDGKCAQVLWRAAQEGEREQCGEEQVQTAHHPGEMPVESEAMQPADGRASEG